MSASGPVADWLPTAGRRSPWRDATVLVAGIVITGGVGSVLNLVPAAVIIAVVGQMITLTGTDAYFQMIFKGVLLLAAMGIYQLAGSGVRIPWRLRAPALRRTGENA